jgi:hypothetical protein
LAELPGRARPVALSISAADASHYGTRCDRRPRALGTAAHPPQRGGPARRIAAQRIHPRGPCGRTIPSPRRGAIRIWRARGVGGRTCPAAAPAGHRPPPPTKPHGGAPPGPRGCANGALAHHHWSSIRRGARSHDQRAKHVIPQRGRRLARSIRPRPTPRAPTRRPQPQWGQGRGAPRWPACQSNQP